MSAALNDRQIAERLSKLSGWAPTEHGGWIRKQFKLDSYMAGLAFASAVGTVCEARNHHPEIWIGWCIVTVTFTTHDAGSQLTDQDFDAAAAIDALGYP